MRRVLYLDDDPDILIAAEILLARHQMVLVPAATPAIAETILAQEAVDAILLDLNFRRGDTSGAEGLAFLDRILARDPRARVVIVTGHSGINIAVAAMRRGAADFVMKPWHNDRFVATIRAAIDQPRPAPPPPEPDDLNLDRTELALIKEALKRHHHNISQAAKALGLTRAALYRRMEKHGL